MKPTALYEVINATWPAAGISHAGGCVIRKGADGGSRVSAATLNGTLDLPAAEAAMRGLGQTPLFMIRDGDDAFEATLADAGYAIMDPVNIYMAPVESLVQTPPPVSFFTVFPPLQAQADIWAEGGINAARLAVMDRAPMPKSTFLGRTNDRPAATAFAAIYDGCVMLHALETAPRDRRQGVARNMMGGIAKWGQTHGADQFALLVTQANVGANALYASLGMTVVGHYHYRIKREQT